MCICRKGEEGERERRREAIRWAAIGGEPWAWISGML